MKRFILGALAGLVAVCASATAIAGPQLLVTNGILQGATDVVVNGSLFSVKFVDGTCEELFGDCTNTANFPFSYNNAILASQALLDQVLQDGQPGDNFFDFRAKVAGCEVADACSIFTPQAWDATLQRVWVSSAEAYVVSAFDPLLVRETGCCGEAGLRPAVDLDLTGFDNRTWAVWKAPEPSSFALILGAVAGAGAIRRRVRARPA